MLFQKLKEEISMSVLINFKICDNADVCSGLEVCQTGAIYWDDNNKILETNNSKCTCCSLCVDACPAGAIAVASNEEEYAQLQRSFNEDPRTIKDLMIERYGASPIDESILISISEANKKIRGENNLLAIEIIDDSDTACLINSVPISELFVDAKCLHFKITSNDNDYNVLAKKYSICKIPTFLLFFKGELCYKKDGMVNNQLSEESTAFISEVKTIIKNLLQ